MEILVCCDIIIEESLKNNGIVFGDYVNTVMCNIDENGPVGEFIMTNKHTLNLWFPYTGLRKILKLLTSFSRYQYKIINTNDEKYSVDIYLEDKLMVKLFIFKDFPLTYDGLVAKSEYETIKFNPLTICKLIMKEKFKKCDKIILNNEEWSYIEKLLNV